MSFCPNKDIHSLYLDNELPEIYKAEYEEHLKTCKKCQSELEKIRKIHELFHADSKQIMPDKNYLNESYARLLTKMSFSKNTRRKSSSENKTIFRNIGYVACAAAAVAIFALILPLRTATKTQNPAAVASVTPDINSNIVLLASRASHADNLAVRFNSQKKSQGFVTNVNSSGNSQNQNQLTIIPDNDVELLRPELDSISIKITLPGIDSVPVTTEVNVPMDVVSGRK